jgi:hypothetical protein
VVEGGRAGRVMMEVRSVRMLNVGSSGTDGGMGTRFAEVDAEASGPTRSDGHMGQARRCWGPTSVYVYMVIPTNQSQ